jgi:hypothetical protein
MPIPRPNQNEENNKFVARCMSNDTMKKEYPDEKQRVAICLGQTKREGKNIFAQVLEILGFSLSYSECGECGNEEEVTESNFIQPSTEDYIDCDEPVEEYEITFSKYEYIDPLTQEVYYFDKLRDYRKDGRKLVYRGEASEYQGRKVTLNKPFRTPNGPKKFSVYVKNEKGNVVKVNFGDPNMKIKKNIPERRKSFRARHNCDSPGPKWKARYWSCKAW